MNPWYSPGGSQDLTIGDYLSMFRESRSGPSFTPIYNEPYRPTITVEPKPEAEYNDDGYGLNYLRTSDGFGGFDSGTAPGDLGTLGEGTSFGNAVNDAFSSVANDISGFESEVGAFVDSPFTYSAEAIDNFGDDVASGINDFGNDVSAFMDAPGETISNSLGYGESAQNAYNSPNTLGNLGTIGSLATGIPFLGLFGAGIGSINAANVANAASANSFGLPDEASALDAFLDAISFGMFGNSMADQLSDLGAEVSSFPDGNVSSANDFGEDTALGSFGVGAHPGENAFSGITGGFSGGGGAFGTGAHPGER